MALVAETAASAIIGQLVETVLNYASSSWWPGGTARTVKAEAEKLQAALPKINAVLIAVQGEQIKQKNSAFDARLWQFRDAIEAADDVLDEIKYYELEEKIKARDSKVSGLISGCKRKLADFFTITFVNDGILNKLRDAVKGLEAIASDMGLLVEIANSLNQQVVAIHFRETSSIINSSVIGREREKTTIVQWLTRQPDGEDQQLLSIFSIYGMGGMGKTTLAQLVCNDERVIEKFDKILWVCVSDNFSTVNAKTIIKMILEDITKKSCNLDNLNALHTELKGHVASKKFLLVLDDVWGDDSDTISEWEKVVAPLRSGEKGSKILLTTRMESVTKMISGVMEGENKYLYLSSLAENDFMTLFYRHAFAGTDPDKHQHLHGIGNKIAKKLWACPLAAKVIGGALNNNFSFEFWNKVLNEDMLNIQANKHYIMEILKLSYYYLPTHLQLCFRYCSIFPQDYRFGKNKLIKMWMGSGLISLDAHENRRPEDVANEYLDQLTKKSFFYMDEEKYLIHDLLHDLAQTVAKGECASIMGDIGINIPLTVRHLYVETRSISVLKKIRNLNKLHTLVIYCDNLDLDSEQELNKILSEVKSLRLLHVAKKKKREILSTIADLIHLRYLYISYYGIYQPHITGIFCTLKPLCKLYHLQVLEIDTYSPSWHIQESELEDMCNLINLRYFDFTSLTNHKIPCIGKLRSLQELGDFEVRNEVGYEIGELQDLSDLYKLSVDGLKNISNPDDALEAEIHKKEKLKSLELVWNGNPIEVRNEEEVVADNLKPPTNLIELKINHYSGFRSPCWMIDQSCCNLISVSLSHCDKWEHLPPLGQLNSLEHLKLHHMSAVKQLGYSFYGNCGACIFPSLRKLDFWGMPEWEEFIEPGDKLLFPCLDELAIKRCPKLKKLPTMPTSLSELTLCDTALDTLPEIFQAPENNTVDVSMLRSSLSSLHVNNCPNIVTLVGCHLLEQPENLHALKYIHISQCRNLLHINDELLVKLPCLTHLTIMDCPRLVSREIQVPTMLKTLSFGSYDAPESLYDGQETLFIRSLQDLTSLVKLEIRGCPSIQYLPPAEVLAKLTALRSLQIMSCKELASLSGMEGLTALRNLEIYQCEKLNEVSSQQPPLLYHSIQVDSASHHLKIDDLVIDHTSLLLMEPLRSLMFIRELHILDDSQVTSLPEQWLLQNRLSLEILHLVSVNSLESLPPRIEGLCSLRQLSILGAQFTTLPKLPKSLTRLHLSKCHPELEELCKRGTGLYWPMISCIPDVLIYE